jgi:hypothetical protein
MIGRGRGTNSAVDDAFRGIVADECLSRSTYHRYELHWS